MDLFLPLKKFVILNFNLLIFTGLLFFLSLYTVIKVCLYKGCFALRRFIRV